ncbi:MAG: hypothetical protein Q4A75_05625 [Peptostreptococcaceae bacterium]|nr:hypothetical protein [Peptostreptococcaceae bacterium]
MSKDISVSKGGIGWIDTIRYVTFDFESGDRMDLHIPRADYE